LNARRARSGLTVLLLVGAIFGADRCASPAKPTPVDPYPDGPKITCPAPPSTVTAPTSAGVSVQYGTATATGGAPPVNTTCTPSNGSIFNIGTTMVTCVASDSRQRTDQCSFTVVVQQPARLIATSFVGFGDSITAGEDGRAALTAPAAAARPRLLLPASQTYPGVLEQLLRGRYTTQSPTVANSGLPGEKAGASPTLTRFANTLSLGNFQVVLIMEGSNDIVDRDAGEIPAAIQGLRNMIQMAKGRNVKPLLATVPPMVPNTQRGLAWDLVPALNGDIRKLAASENVPLVDIEAAFGSSYGQYIGTDGLHPNPQGYAKIADTFFGVIRGTLESATTAAAAAQIRTTRRR